MVVLKPNLSVTNKRLIKGYKQVVVSYHLQKKTNCHKISPSRWLPGDFTKVTLQTGMGYKRNSSSVLLSLLLRFESNVTNIITLLYWLLLLRYRTSKE